PAVPGGATGGGTWSKKPPLSSQVSSRTVLAHRSGWEVRASRTWLTPYWPQRTGVGGCSVHTNWRLTHETAGSCPDAQSAAKSVGDVRDENAGPAKDGLFRNCWKKNR